MDCLGGSLDAERSGLHRRDHAVLGKQELAEVHEVGSLLAAVGRDLLGVQEGLQQRALLLCRQLEDRVAVVSGQLAGAVKEGGHALQLFVLAVLERPGKGFALIRQRFCAASGSMNCDL